MSVDLAELVSAVPVLHEGDAPPEDGWAVRVSRSGQHVLVRPEHFTAGIGSYLLDNTRTARTAAEVDRHVRWAVSYCRRQILAERRAEDVIEAWKRRPPEPAPWTDPGRALDRDHRGRLFGIDPTLLWMTGLLLAFGAGFLLGVVAF